jgi:hypothetical protein
MARGEFAGKGYEAARQEFVEHIRTRDVILFRSLTGLGAVFGYALKANNVKVLLIVPYLTVGFLGLVFHHHQAIRAIMLSLGLRVARGRVLTVEFNCTRPSSTVLCLNGAGVSSSFARRS